MESKKVAAGIFLQKMTVLSELAKKYKYFLFDCDGVLWHGGKMVGNAFRNIETLEQMGVKCFFVTNLGGTSRKHLARKMISDAFGYQHVSLDQLYPASTLAGLHLKQTGSKKVWMVGMPAMREELEAHGLQVYGEGKLLGSETYDKPEDHITWESIDAYQLEPDIDAVVQGTDLTMTYSKMAIASLYLQKGAKWVVTNQDAYGRTAAGYRFPGNGCLTAYLETLLKKSDGPGLICEKTNVGKPNPKIVDIIRSEHNIPESELPKFLMIGDNPATDIALGSNAGIDTCLVLTGVVQSEEDLLNYIQNDPKSTPTHIINSMGDEFK